MRLVPAVFPLAVTIAILHASFGCSKPTRTNLNTISSIKMERGTAIKLNDGRTIKLIRHFQPNWYYNNQPHFRLIDSTWKLEIEDQVWSYSVIHPKESNKVYIPNFVNFCLVRNGKPIAFGQELHVF